MWTKSLLLEASHQHNALHYASANVKWTVYLVKADCHCAPFA